MPDWLRRLSLLLEKPACVLGVLSGTSADGIDVAICRIVPRTEAGREGHPDVKLLHHFRATHEADIQLLIAHADTLGARRLAELHRGLGERFAQACMQAIAAGGLQPADVDLIGSHGQTFYHHSHLPGAERCTLQIGDGDCIAELTGLPVVSDFRARDIAAGGEGAPITPIADHVLFDPMGPYGRRAVLNLGGIANITVLDEDPSRILGFDVGPANSLLDRLTRRLTDGRLSFDVDGKLAAQGTVNQAILDRLLIEDPFLQRRPPKSTGFEMYGDALLDKVIAWHGNADVDLLATVAEFTARAVGQALTRHIDPDRPIGEVVVAGGGAANPDLMRRLAAAIAPRTLTRSDALGVPLDAREAMSFAILAHRAITGMPSTWPGLTGVRHPVVLGKLSFPFCAEKNKPRHSPPR